MISDEDKHYLLDTNIISEIIKYNPDFNVIKRITEHSSDMAISVLTWHELLYGTIRLPDGIRKRELEKYLREDVFENFPVIPFERKDAEIHAGIRIELEKRGTSMPFGDTQIAATALANDMILVTRNTDHFAEIGIIFPLKMENWFN